MPKINVENTKSTDLRTKCSINQELNQSRKEESMKTDIKIQ